MPNKHEFPKLYKLTNNGKIQENQIIVFDRGNEAAIKTFRGYVGGKITCDEPTIVSCGKNIGKSNETSYFEQAISDAQSKWNKKRDEGYCLSIEETENDVLVLPMLAKRFQDQKKHIKFPCFCQPKFDGIRSNTVVLPDGTVSIKSRKGKEFPHLNHLRMEAKSFPVGQYIDGELYSDDLTFEQITGIVRSETLSPEKQEMILKIKIRAYDSFKVGIDEDFDVRHSILNNVIAGKEHFTLVKNYITESESDVKKYHDKFVQDGFEGVIIRNIKGAYELDKRSNNLQKFKVFIDDEFEIVGFTEGTGNETGCVVWICKTKDGEEFSCRPRGVASQRKEWFENGNAYIGKMLMIRFFEYSTDKKIPRFPVGLVPRDFE